MSMTPSTFSTDPSVDPGGEPYVEPERTDPSVDPGAEPYTEPDPDEEEFEPAGAPDEDDPDA